MRRSVSFFVPGVPIAQGSKRHVGRGRLIESSKQLAPWRSTVALAAQAAYNETFLGQGLLEGPLIVNCRFVFPRPKAHRRANGELRESAPWRHASRPDVDKLARAVLDGITGVVIRDDSQVADLRATKEYGDEPGAEILVMGIATILDVSEAAA